MGFTFRGKKQMTAKKRARYKRLQRRKDNMRLTKCHSRLRARSCLFRGERFFHAVTITNIGLLLASSSSQKSGKLAPISQSRIIKVLILLLGEYMKFMWIFWSLLKEEM